MDLELRIDISNQANSITRLDYEKEDIGKYTRYKAKGEGR
jgi:hypothetical protein